MSEHHVTLNWQLGSNEFTYEKYPRQHTITFAGGVQITNTAAPDYLGDAKLSNPEELLIAAVASCYLLTFLAIASKMGFIIQQYSDKPVGVLGKNAQGRMAVTEIRLQPQITFGGDKQPDAATLNQMHTKAHQYCFITNSVTAEVKVQH